MANTWSPSRKTATIRPSTTNSLPPDSGSSASAANRCHMRLQRAFKELRRPDRLPGLLSHSNPESSTASIIPGDAPHCRIAQEADFQIPQSQIRIVSEGKGNNCEQICSRIRLENRRNWHWQPPLHSPERTGIPAAAGRLPVQPERPAHFQPGS